RISIARNKERGTEVIRESILSYLVNFYPEIKENTYNINFIDRYVGKGYADIYPQITETIKNVAKTSSILLDPVYTGKAFYGMIDYMKLNDIRKQNILFIHTGGIPLLFNYASMFKKG